MTYDFVCFCLIIESLDFATCTLTTSSTLQAVEGAGVGVQVEIQSS